MFFPGGSIGDLAVNGTVNDLAMSGATPLFLSTAFILAGGHRAGRHRPGRRGDGRGRRGRRRAAGHRRHQGGRQRQRRRGLRQHRRHRRGRPTASTSARARAAARRRRCIVSGDIGVHGVAVMSCREGLEFGTTVESDTAPLHGLVAAMLATGADVHVLRDPTRGGVAASLNEIARASGVGIDAGRAGPADPADGARRLRPARPRPAPGRQRGQAARVRARRSDADEVLAAMRAHPLRRRRAA